MFSFASQTWRMATSSIYRAPDREDSELEIAHNAMEIPADIPGEIPTDKSHPVVIPNVNNDEMDQLAFSSMSAMSLATTIPMDSQASSLASSGGSSPDDEVSDDDLEIYTMAEVQEHRDVTDAWMVIYDKVYDVTEFLEEVHSLSLY